MSEFTTKEFALQIVKSSSGDYDAQFILSDASVDRVGDTIDEKAYDAVAAASDKVIALFNHDTNKIAGYWTNLKREGTSLVADLKLATTNIGRMCKAALESGVPLSASIGFRGKGSPNKKGGLHFSSLELMETSLVATPAHPAAQRIKALAAEYEVQIPEFDEDAADQLVEKQMRIHDVKNRAAAAIEKANQSINRVKRT